MSAPGSLWARLLLLLGGSALAVWLVIAVLTVIIAQDETEELFDSQLAAVATVLQRLPDLPPAAGFPAPLSLTEPDELHERRQLAFTTYDRAGRPWMRASGQIPVLPLPDHPGFVTATVDGTPWRLLRQDLADRILVVGEQQTVRGYLSAELVEHLMWPVLIALALMALSLAWGLRVGLRPLGRLAVEVSALEPGRMDAVAEPRERELRPLVRALNGLLGRLMATLERERRFTADAAHELRTPLAAVRLHAELARDSRVPATRRQALDDLLSGIDRSSRLLDQLLTLARVDPLLTPARSEPVDLAPLVHGVVAELGALSAGRVRIIGTQTPPFRGDPLLLRVLIRNLIDNALRYTIGAVTVAMTAEGLSVCDTGPGLPESVRTRLGERFVRGETGDAQGSGLGLSIVLRIAQLHGIDVQIGTEEGGMRVTLTQPPVG